MHDDGFTSNINVSSKLTRCNEVCRRQWMKHDIILVRFWLEIKRTNGHTTYPTCFRVSTPGEFHHSGQQGPLSARLRLPSARKLLETLVAQTGDFIRIHCVTHRGGRVSGSQQVLHKYFNS